MRPLLHASAEILSLINLWQQTWAITNINMSVLSWYYIRMTSPTVFFKYIYTYICNNKLCFYNIRRVSIGYDCMVIITFKFDLLLKKSWIFLQVDFNIIHNTMPLWTVREWCCLQQTTWNENNFAESAEKLDFGLF